MLVARIAIQSSIISARAAPRLCAPKKINVHALFNTSWITNTVRAIRVWVWVRFLKTRNAEIPMRVYRVVQTGAKMKLGGFHEGFAISANNVGIEPMVTDE